MAAELGQQTVEFSALVSRVAEDSFLSLKELVDKSKSSDQSDSEKKFNILKYVFKTEQRMLRLYALAMWCKQVGCWFFSLSLLHFLNSCLLNSLRCSGSSKLSDFVFSLNIMENSALV